MRVFTLFAILLLSSVSATAINYFSNASGNWNTAATWSPAGIPQIGDSVIIRNGHDIIVSGSANCKGLNIIGSTTGLLLDRTTLTINSGASLNVSGSITQNVSANLLAGSATGVTVLGVLTAGTNYLLNNISTILSSNNQLTIGSSTAAGRLALLGNFTQSNTTTNLLFQANTVNIIQGELDIRGSIFNTSGGLNLVNTNIINVQDDGVNTAKRKRIYLGGSIYNTNQGSLQLTDANGDADYQLIMNGNTTQLIATTNVVYRDLIIANEDAEVQMVNNLSNTQIRGNVRILSNAVLNVKSFNLDAINARVNQIIIDSAGTLKTEAEDGIPAQRVNNAYVLSSHPKGIIEYSTTSNLNVLKEQYDYPIVKLTGVGVKTLDGGANLNNTSLKVGEIDLTEGTFVFPDGKTLTLNGSYGRKLVTLRANTIFEIRGFINNQDVFFNIDRNNTTKYISNGEQTLYSFKSNATTTEPYGILSLERLTGNGSLNRNIANNINVQVKNKLVFDGKTKLRINQGASMELISDKDFTAYVAAIPGGSTIEYLGNPVGKFIANRFINLPDDNFRDFSSPIKGNTLKSWQDAGMLMTGFPGSDFPEFEFLSAYFYDEKDKGILDDGFVAADNITNLVHKFSGANITNGAWRIYAGEFGGLNLMLKDQGQIYTGDVNFNVSFTRGNFSRDNDDGWNFIGNPYPASIDWKKVYQDTDNKAAFATNGIQSTAYVWQPNDKNNPLEIRNSYGFYNPITGVSDGLNSEIPSFQGFWVKTKHATSATANYTLRLKESHKVDVGNSKFFKAEDEEKAPTTVQFALSGNDADSKIWFHLWPDASANADEEVDVPKLGNAPLDNAFLDFTFNNQELNLWVNALSKGAQNNSFNVLLATPFEGTYTLSAKNLDAFTAEYGCVIILDKLTNQYITLNDNQAYTFTSAAGFRAERFTVFLYRTLSQLITTADATCFGKEDGKLYVNLDQIKDEVNFSLFKNGSLFKTYTGLLDKIDINLGAGNYILVNNIGFIGCLESQFNFTVNQQPEVKSNFVVPSGLITTGKAITFTNNSLNAIGFEWYFEDDNSISTERTPTHVFNNPGFFTVKLIAFGQNSSCSNESSRVLNVAQATSISDLNESGISLKVIDGMLQYSSNSTENIELSIYTLDGRMVKQITCPNSDCKITLEKENKIWIVRIRQGEKEYQQSIFN